MIFKKNVAKVCRISGSHLLKLSTVRIAAAGVALLSIAALVLSDRLPASRLATVPEAKANSVYANLASGNLKFSISASTTNLITSNDDWSGVPSVEGYQGKNLTATHGVDPQTVLGTEFANNQLPNSPTNVAANKGNPSAFNAGGLAEFDTGTPIGLGFQGNVQANPYLVFYLNTTGRQSINVQYRVEDLDGGSNNSVSQLALQYRVGETGNFINLPAGYIADATDGGVAGRVTNINVTLPAAAENKPKVQVRILTTNAADPTGGSTPDEWIGINNVTIGSLAPTAAAVSVGGRVIGPGGRGIRGALVTLYDVSGGARTAITNPFGYYNFTGISAGAVYTFEVADKRHKFSASARAVTVMDETNGIDFVSDN